MCNIIFSFPPFNSFFHLSSNTTSQKKDISLPLINHVQHLLRIQLFCLYQLSHNLLTQHVGFFLSRLFCLLILLMGGEHAFSSHILTGVRDGSGDGESFVLERYNEIQNNSFIVWFQCTIKMCVWARSPNRYKNDNHNEKMLFQTKKSMILYGGLREKGWFAHPKRRLLYVYC